MRMSRYPRRNVCSIYQCPVWLPALWGGRKRDQFPSFMNAGLCKFGRQRRQCRSTPTRRSLPTVVILTRHSTQSPSLNLQFPPATWCPYVVEIHDAFASKIQMRPGFSLSSIRPARKSGPTRRSSARFAISWTGRRRLRASSGRGFILYSFVGAPS